MFDILSLNSLVIETESKASAVLSQPLDLKNFDVASFIISSGIVTTVLKNPVIANSRPPQISPLANVSQLFVKAPILPIIRVRGQNSLPPSLASNKTFVPIFPKVLSMPLNPDVMPVKIPSIESKIDIPVPFITPLSKTFCAQPEPPFLALELLSFSSRLSPPLGVNTLISFERLLEVFSLVTLFFLSCATTSCNVTVFAIYCRASFLFCSSVFR